MDFKKRAAEIVNNLLSAFQQSDVPLNKRQIYFASQLVNLNSKVKITYELLKEVVEILDEKYSSNDVVFMDDDILHNIIRETKAYSVDISMTNDKKWNDIYIYCVISFIKYFLPKECWIGEAIESENNSGPEYFSKVYQLNDAIQTNRKLRYNQELKEIHFIGHVSSQLAKVLFQNEYPNGKWLSYGEKDEASSTKYDLFFLDKYPWNVVDTRQVPDDEYGISEEEVYDIDYAQYEAQIQQCVKMINHSGYLVTPYGELDCNPMRPSPLTAKQYKQIADIWERQGLFVRLIVRVNKSRMFFFLRCSKENAEKYTILDYSIKGKDENAIIIHLDDLMNKANQYSYVSGVLRNIDSIIKFDGSLESVYKKQDEKDAVDIKRTGVGFREMKGKDLIDWSKKIREYKPNPFKRSYRIPNIPMSFLYVPKSLAIFGKVGPTFNLLDMYKKICVSGMKYGELDFAGIKWYEHCKKEYISLVGPHWNHDLMEFPMNKPWEELVYSPWVVIPDPDHSISNAAIDEIADDYYWNRVIEDQDFLYDPSYNGDDLLSFLCYSKTFLDRNQVYLRKIENSKAIYDFQEFQGMDEEGYSPFQKILAEIIQANIWAIPFNKSVILPSYFELYLKTTLGEKFLDDWRDKCQQQDVLKAFKTTTLYLPDIEHQRNLLDDYQDLESKIDDDSKRIETYRHHQWDILKTIGENRPLVHPIREEVSAAELPQALASILYLDKCETGLSKKKDNLVNCLEAAATLHAVVMLSLLYAIDPKFSNQIINEKFNLNSADKDGYIKISFGLWTDMVRRILEIYNRKIATNEEYNQRHFSIINSFFSKDENESLLEALTDGKKFRDEDAHGGRPADGVDENLYLEANDLCLKVRRQFLSVYSDIEFLYAAKIESDYQGKHFLKAYQLKGANARPRYNEREVDSDITLAPSASRMHLFLKGKLVPILPFIFMGQLIEKENPYSPADDPYLLSTYYISSIQISKEDCKWGEIEWKSFDCGAIRNTSYNYDDPSVELARNIIDMLHDAHDEKNKDH